jgi:uncharacterized protein YndB with AHSA1/START domain
VNFTNTVVIQRPCAEVFAFLADFENLPRWNYAISRTSKTSDGPVGVGTRYLQARTLPAHSEEAFEVSEYEPDRRVSVTGTFGPFPGRVTYQLERVGDATRLTNTMDLEPTGLLRLAAPLATTRVKEAVAKNLHTLKELLERPTE